MPSAEDYENPDQLPRPELNPMLNPLLGQNLGRWAEVYFTSAPEDRERAVEELLKELQAHQTDPEKDLPDHAAEEASVPESPVQELVPAAEQESDHLPSADAIRRQIWSENDERKARHRFYSTFAAASPRHYVLAGAVFAVVGILILVYTVWGGSRSAASQSQQVQAPSLEKPSSSEPNGPSGRSRPGLGQQAQAQPAARIYAPVTTVRPIPLAGTTQPGITLPAAGAQELALAKSYLDGSNGKTRESSEAAKWLWKAVAKQNAEATGLLATLYLKGDGVAKNCDQARVLLDAAARKGIATAVEQLTNIRTFGCE